MERLVLSRLPMRELSLDSAIEASYDCISEHLFECSNARRNWNIWQSLISSSLNYWDGSLKRNAFAAHFLILAE